MGHPASVETPGLWIFHYCKYRRRNRVRVRRFPKRPKGSEGRKETPQVAPQRVKGDQRKAIGEACRLPEPRSKTRCGPWRRPKEAAGLRSRVGDAPAAPKRPANRIQSMTMVNAGCAKFRIFALKREILCHCINSNSPTWAKASLKQR